MASASRPRWMCGPSRPFSNGTRLLAMSASSLDPAADSAALSEPADSSLDAAKKPRVEKQEILDAFSQDHLKWSNVDWTTFVWMTLIHAGCFAAPFYFNWTALIVAVVFHWLTCSIGVCLGYHRLLSHRSLKVAAPVRFFVTFCGVISGEGTPLNWAATHRLHHAQSDKEGDPHSPLEGPWWSHLLWMFLGREKSFQDKLYSRYVPDLKEDRLMQMFERTYPLWLFGHAAVIYLLLGLPGLFWAVCVRMTMAYHSTWFVNSATHLWGYRNYETTDASRNLWWVALLAYGEGWHNNHHAHPAIARAGHKWWEFDMTWMAILTLKKLGLAYDINDRLPAPKASSAARKDAARAESHEHDTTSTMAS